MAQEKIEIIGQVVSGRGRASGLIKVKSRDINTLTGENVIPGSLNILLHKPIMFNNKRARRFDNDYRLIWPGEVNGMAVWLYRWQTAPLHVIEVLSSVNLRNQFGLIDNDSVTIAIDRGYLENASLLGRITWMLCWLGRRNWCYRSVKYCFVTAPLCRHFGATQQGPNAALMMNANSMKVLIKNIPIVGPLAIRVKRFVKPAFKFSYEPPQLHESVEEMVFRQLRNILNYTKLGGSDYSAVQYPAGYHTIEIFGRRLRGQRSPSERLRAIPIDFEGKVVLDIGSNQGGMLFAVKDKIKSGVGIDSDPRMVNAANKISICENANNIRFYVFDVERDPLDLIVDLMPEGRIDVVFLLSVCMWIKNWREVIAFCAKKAKCMVFESNGTHRQQKDQEAALRRNYENVTLLSDSSRDDPGQNFRRLFLCGNS